jgi:hypothetical protein
MKRRVAFLAPFLVSAAASTAVLGDRVYWQDEGFFLCAVKDLAVLYPPGFVPYLLLCKAWTLLLGFLDFVLAVHLFSAACAAAAAGVLGLAVRDQLESKGPLMGGGGVEGVRASAAGAAVGALWACGYTFWFSGLYAKGYSLYYLVLAGLLWRMIRADATGTRRDFLLAAVLIGLAWQAHPSATLGGAALLAFAIAGGARIGWKPALACAGAAALAALLPSLLLLAFSRHPSPVSFGAPESLPELAEYLAGRRFVGQKGVFGWDPARWADSARFFLEEFLGIGLVLIAAGLVRWARFRPRLLAGAALWMVPYWTVTALFLIEGQDDHWYVAAWLPLSLAAGEALAAVRGPRGPLVSGLAAVAGAAWAAGVNAPLLDLRRYEAAETYGRAFLEPLDRDAILLSASDDSGSIPLALQRLRGLRNDVLLVRSSHLGPQEGGGLLGWYDRLVLLQDPRLRLPDYWGHHQRFPGRPGPELAQAAFANANVGPLRPVYFERPPLPGLIREDYHLVPAGSLMKMVPRGSDGGAPGATGIPQPPEELRGSWRRARGQWLDVRPDGVRFRREPYERRLFMMQLRALLLAAEWRLLKGAPGETEALLARIARLDADLGAGIDVALLHGRALAALGRAAEARARLETAFADPEGGAARAEAAALRADLAVDPAEARAWLENALAVPGIDPALRAALERRR